MFLNGVKLLDEDEKFLAMDVEDEFLSIDVYFVILVGVEKSLRRNRGVCPRPPHCRQGVPFDLRAISMRDLRVKSTLFVALT